MPIFLGELLKDEACLEEVDGRLSTEEKAVGKKGDDELLGVRHDTARSYAKRLEKLY